MGMDWCCAYVCLCHGIYGLLVKDRNCWIYISSHADFSIKSLSHCLSQFLQLCPLDTFSKACSFVLLCIFLRREGLNLFFGGKSGWLGLLVNGL